MSTQHDIVFIGNFTKDWITTPNESRTVDGGGMNYSAHAALKMGLNTAVITRLAQEDRRVVERLERTGATCYPEFTPQSTCIHLDYPTADPDIRTITVTSFAGAFTLAQLAGWEARAGAVNASWRGEMPLEVLKSLREKIPYLAADMQGFARVVEGGTLSFQPWDEMAETLACLDVVKTDAVEAEYLTGETDIEKAARRFASYGPKEIVLTHRDGLLVYAFGKFYHAPWRARNLSGRSGRGDTCLGSYLSKRLSAEPAEATVWAAALTSLKMEAPRPFDRDLSEVEILIREAYREA